MTRRLKVSPRMAAELRGQVLDDQVAACARCKCTEDLACAGGCQWVTELQHLGVLGDVCDSCVTDDEWDQLQYLGLVVL